MSVLNTNDDDLPVANETPPARYVPYYYHERDENWFAENESNDYNRIEPHDQRYFLLPKHNTGSGIRRRRRRKIV